MRQFRDLIKEGWGERFSMVRLLMMKVIRRLNIEGSRFTGRRLEIADPNRVNRPAFNKMYMWDQSSKGDKWFNMIYAISINRNELQAPRRMTE